MVDGLIWASTGIQPSIWIGQEFGIWMVGLGGSNGMKARVYRSRIWDLDGGAGDRGMNLDISMYI